MRGDCCGMHTPRFAILGIIIFSLVDCRPAHAGVDEVVACAGQPDEKARLACYDAAVAKLKSEIAEAKTKGQTLFGLPIPFMGPRTEDDFGKPPAPPPELKEMTELTAKLVGWSKDPLGRSIVVLDNGQVWKIMDYKPLLISTAGTTTVRIERRMMGGYYMSVNGADSNLTVSRLK